MRLRFPLFWLGPVYFCGDAGVVEMPMQVNAGIAIKATAVSNLQG
jgi:hypothetical protein